MIVSGESNVDETATPPLDYVVSGAQLLTVTVKYNRSPDYRGLKSTGNRSLRKGTASALPFVPG